MKNVHRIIGGVLLTFLPVYAQPSNQIEPKAGTWKTWAISSAKDYRVPPPPDAATTQIELRWLKEFVTTGQTDPRASSQIAFWDAGSPTYRWIDLISSRIFNGQPVSAFPHRAYAYVAMAMYDATIAAWDSKYAYLDDRPSNCLARRSRFDSDKVAVTVARPYEEILHREMKAVEVASCRLDFRDCSGKPPILGIIGICYHRRRFDDINRKAHCRVARHRIDDARAIH